MSIYMNGLGRMTKLVTVSLFCKTFKAFFFITRSIMILKPGIGLKELNAYKVCINEDTWLTLTNLKAPISGERLQNHWSSGFQSDHSFYTTFLFFLARN